MVEYLTLNLNSNGLLAKLWQGRVQAAKIHTMTRAPHSLRDALSLNPSTGGLTLPAWVEAQLSDQKRSQNIELDDTISMQIRTGDTCSIVTCVIEDAISLSASQLRQKVRLGYLGIRDFLREGPPNPIRFWNFIPNIHEPMGDDLDRYMVFNAGRFEAFSSWFELDPRKSQLLPTATGVGHSGKDLVVHCLSGLESGTAVENPRQIPAYEYSQRFGPLPPCFARATIWGGENDQKTMILLGGTASVCGEDSKHPEDVRAQMEETFRNLGALIGAACKSCGTNGQQDAQSWLNRLTDVRIYYKHESDSQLIEQLVSEHITSAHTIEMFPAELCRQELLVEIEGIATTDLDS